MSSPTTPASKPKATAKPRPKSTHLKKSTLEKRARESVNTVKRPALVGIGRDPITGKNIPHTYDVRVAKSISFYVSTGLSENDISEMLNMRPGKLKQLYGQELANGLNVANTQVAKAMHTAAVEGDVVAGKFWLKSRAGWKDGESANTLQSPLQIHIHD